MSMFHSFLNAHRVLDRFIVKRQSPTFDQYMTAYKFPQHAKIVILGGQLPLLQNLISKFIPK